MTRSRIWSADPEDVDVSNQFACADSVDVGRVRLDRRGLETLMAVLGLHDFSRPSWWWRRSLELKIVNLVIRNLPFTQINFPKPKDEKAATSLVDELVRLRLLHNDGPAWAELEAWHAAQVLAMEES